MWRRANPYITPDFSGADLNDADLKTVDLSGADLTEAKVKFAFSKLQPPRIRPILRSFTFLTSRFRAELFILDTNWTLRFGVNP
jgi:uncharacterized protein YjbI with pentapeptide repeats